TAPAAVRAATCAAPLWPSVEIRAEPCILSTGCTYLSHKGSPMASVSSFSCETCDFRTACTQRYNPHGVGPYRYTNNVTLRGEKRRFVTRTPYNGATAAHSVDRTQRRAPGRPSSAKSRTLISPASRIASTV